MDTKQARKTCYSSVCHLACEMCMASSSLKSDLTLRDCISQLFVSDSASRPRLSKAGNSTAAVPFAMAAALDQGWLND